MQIIRSIKEMQGLSDSFRHNKERIAFVPTMGALHDGHLSLLREGRRVGDRLVLSIFVNPKQFAPNEDLARYPRDTDGDLKKAGECGTDVVFLPSDGDMYPPMYQTFVEVTEVTKGLCGASRPSHFRGVATVVMKLINIVRPDIMIMGEKDYQQLIVLKTMVRDLNIPLEVIGMPIIRDSDGLAMSSRNAYLGPEERKAALSLPRALKAARDAVKNGEKDLCLLTGLVKETIESERIPRIDYIKICDPETLTELTEFRRPARLLVAAFVGTTRLIDNCEL